MKLPFIATILVSHCFHRAYVKYNKKHRRTINCRVCTIVHRANEYGKQVVNSWYYDRIKEHYSITAKIRPHLYIYTTVKLIAKLCNALSRVDV